MHRRISSTFNTLRQDLAAKLGCDFIQAGSERVILTHPERLILTLPGRQDGRSGQER